MDINILKLIIQKLLVNILIQQIKLNQFGVNLKDL